LGAYIKEKTGADMILWDGACIVHDEFKAKGLRELKAVHPHAMVLVHPESPKGVVDQADVVGSTSQLIKAAVASDQDTFIVATDQGIFYKMRQAAPGKTFMAAPTAGHGAECKSCANCPWMAMNTLAPLASALRLGDNEITVPPALAEKALLPLERMLNFNKV